ncbi:MAG: RsmB/NOP family class I SAM-dependent RNA methyltransferase, partial [Planctomycetes bacterium]|nr:RsmB/NOP family class I SAM-dependent RNA methyltransferase [Planctomycetota bacterium]
LVRDLAAQLGDQPDAALAALNRQPHLCTRRRAGRPLPRGRSLLREDGEWQWWSDPHEVLSGPVADGLCAVQDRTQGHPVEIARPRPLELVLDLCAAPGGKALALADVGCRVIAADLMASRLATMRAQLPGRLVANDGRTPALAEGAFDLVLVDAPCSNTGVLARRPEARWRYDDQHLASLADLQRELLASAARLVAHDGRMVYATCSVSPRENQAIAHSLPGWRLLGERSTWPDEWQAGGYAALLVRA